MRKKDFDDLENPYENQPKGLFDNRFESAIGADTPSAINLVEEIYNDLDINLFGIKWWSNLSTPERILISDYLFQSIDGIQINLTEAKLHYLEWLDAREKSDKEISNLLLRKAPTQKPIQDLYRKLVEMHICGFFRAIGSSLDCLGTAIVGVLALPVSLRRSDIGKAERALSQIISVDDGSKIQVEFRDFFNKLKKSCGVEDWLEWSDQYRNMYVHRGRRTIHYQIFARETNLLASKGMSFVKTEATTHLAKYPDRSDVEAFIKSKNINLTEDAEATLSGVFKSCRELNEKICERLVSIWQERRKNPSLLEQPKKQWDNKIRPCKFKGYKPGSKPIRTSQINVNPIVGRRMLSSSVLDHQRHLWNNSDWS